MEREECGYCIYTGSEMRVNEEFGLGLSVHGSEGKYYLWFSIIKRPSENWDRINGWGEDLSLGGKIGTIHYCPICGRKLDTIQVFEGEEE